MLILAFVDDTFFQHTVMRGFATQVLRRRNGRDDRIAAVEIFSVQPILSHCIALCLLQTKHLFTAREEENV